MDVPGVTVVKNLPAMQEPQEMWVRSLGWERDITSCLSERLLSKTLQITNAGEDVEKREPSYTAGDESWSVRNAER